MLTPHVPDAGCPILRLFAKGGSVRGVFQKGMLQLASRDSHSHPWLRQGWGTRTTRTRKNHSACFQDCEACCRFSIRCVQLNMRASI